MSKLPLPRRVYKLTDYETVFAAVHALNDRAILVGGQAVYFWATRYFGRFPELEAFLPYTSQDADYLADVPAAQELASHLESRFCPSPTKGGMLGLSLGDIPLGEDMKVEILGRINGVKNDDVRATSLVVGWQTWRCMSSIRRSSTLARVGTCWDLTKRTGKTASTSASCSG